MKPFEQYYLSESEDEAMSADEAYSVGDSDQESDTRKKTNKKLSISGIIEGRYVTVVVEAFPQWKQFMSRARSNPETLSKSIFAAITKALEEEDAGSTPVPENKLNTPRIFSRAHPKIGEIHDCSRYLQGDSRWLGFEHVLHECEYDPDKRVDCLQKDRQDEDSLFTGIAPHLIPMIKGWRRVVLMWNKQQRAVYIAPCSAVILNEAAMKQFLSKMKTEHDLARFSFEPSFNPTLFYFTPSAVTICEDISVGMEICPIPIIVPKEVAKEARQALSELKLNFE